MSSQCTVLHVDDNPDVLEISSNWADVHAELTWLTASDPDSGSELLSTHEVDCLVSDSFRMIDGEPFLTHVADVFPDLPVVLFTSMDHSALDPAIRRSWTQYVKKGSGEPFDDLFDRVLELTDGPARSLLPVDIAPRAATRADGSDGHASADDWIPIGRYRPEESDDLATVIVSAVEEYTGRDAAEFPPLYDHIDADALAALLHRANGHSRDHVQVRFVYADHELAVTGQGIVLIRPE